MSRVFCGPMPCRKDAKRTSALLTYQAVTGQPAEYVLAQALLQLFNRLHRFHRFAGIQCGYGPVEQLIAAWLAVADDEADALGRVVLGRVALGGWRDAFIQRQFNQEPPRGRG
jgi:hypothetical protein